MARINFIIKAFDATELTILNDLLDIEEKKAETNQVSLPDTFKELRETISRANRYVSGVSDVNRKD